MARIPAASRESVPENQRVVFDELVKSRGEVPASGPGSVMLNAPEVAKRGLELSAYLRRETSLAPRISELGMLLTARENDCRFIWDAHAADGRAAGLKKELVDNLRDKKELTNLAADEAAVVNYGREYFRTHRVSQATFDAALAQFGVLGLTELTNLMGAYALLAFNINAFEVEPSADSNEPLLPV